MSAWGNLEVVFSSIFISASHDLSMDVFNVSFPVTEVSRIEVSTIEIDFVGFSVFSNVCIRKTVILSESDKFISFNVFDFLSNCLIEVADIFVKVVSSKFDLTKDVSMEGSNSAVDVVIGFSSGSTDVFFDSGISFNGLHLNIEVVEFSLGNGDNLSVSLI